MRFTPAIAVAIMTALLLAPVAKAQQAKAERIEEPERIEEVVVVVGSRFHTARSAAEATAPVDILSADEIGRVGNHADLTDSLRALAPS